MLSWYTRKNPEVQAVRWTEDNLDEIREVLGKRTLSEGYVGEDVVEILFVESGDGFDISRTIERGDWLVVDTGSIIKFNDEQFRSAFEERTSEWIWHNAFYDWCCGRCGYIPGNDAYEKGEETLMTIAPKLDVCPQCHSTMTNPREHMKEIFCTDIKM